MKKNIAFVLYRKWAYDIYKQIKTDETFLMCDNIFLISVEEMEFTDKNTIVFSKKEFNEKMKGFLLKNNIELVFYYGWSWMVAESIYNSHVSVCLHPSKLPKYRGGSPIQNQILNNETKSAVTLFKMDSGLDSGDIYKQKDFSLAGDIDAIFNKITKVGTELTRSLLKDYFKDKLVGNKQRGLNKYKVYKRRKEEDGILDFKKLSKCNYKKVFDLYRCLKDPYPNLQIKIDEKIKLKIKEISKTTKKSNTIKLENIYEKINNTLPLTFNLKDSSIVIKKYEVIYL